MIDQGLTPEPEQDEFLDRAINGFTGTLALHPADYLFPDEQERELSIWDDVDWWTGEEKGAPSPPPAFERMDLATSTVPEERRAQKTFAAQEPGSPAAFRAAEQAHKPRAMTTGSFVKRMLARQGEEYEWGGTTKKTGFDCSGIIYRIMQNAGIANFPRTSGEIYAHAKPISLAKAIKTPGAILWHEGHIAVSLGNGKTIEAMGEDYGVVQGDAEGRFTNGGILPETTPGKAARQPHRVPRPKRLETAKPGREVGGNDLTETIPISGAGTFTEAVLSLVHDGVAVETPKGKRSINLEGTTKPKTQDEIVAYARRVAKQYGWSGQQWLALYELGNRESGWNPAADNPTSTALGIPQRLMSNHPFAPGEEKKWQDPRYQVRWFLSYVNQRYGSPGAALRWHDENGWY